MYSIPLAGPALAQSDEAELLERLRAAETPEQGDRIAGQLFSLWSRSGSATMDLLLKRGRDAAERQDWEAAIDHYSALIDHAPDFAEAYMGRSLAFYQTERWGPAIADLERVLALNPQHFGAIRGLATVMEQLGMDDSAFEAYGQALELHPTDEESQEARDRLELGVRGTSL